MNRERHPCRVCRKNGAVFVLLLLSLLLAPVAGAQSTKDSTATAATGDTPAQLSQLADLLEDDAARARLIQTLRHTADQQLEQAAAEPLVIPKVSPQVDEAKLRRAASASDDTITADKTQKQLPPIRQLAQTTGQWAEHIGPQIRAVGGLLTGAASADTTSNAGATSSRFDAAAFWNGLISLALVVAATLVAYLILRLLTGSILAFLAGVSRAAEPGLGRFARRLGAVVLAVVVDIIVVLLAVAAGYITSLLVLGSPEVIGTREILFVNAFAVVELAKVVIRAAFSSRHEGLRLFGMANSVAGWWSIRLYWFVGVVGYCLLLIVPVINGLLAPALGAIVGFVVMAGAYVYALNVILKNRKLLTQRLLSRADQASVAFFAVLQRIVAYIWVVLALAYVTTLFVGSQLTPSGILPFLLTATLQSLVAAAIALGLSGLLTHTSAKHIAISERARQRLPLLERRINAYVPAALKITRAIILVGLILVLTDAWRLFDLHAWLVSPIGTRVVGVVFHLLVVLAVAVALWVVVASILEHSLGRGARGGPNSARQETLLVLIRNALAIVVVTMAVMVALSQIGVDIGPLIAGAGVIGLAIGFGSQKLVADIVTGIFIQIENALNTGDWVDLAGYSGTVERLTIRSVSLRGLDGTLHVVPFSSASAVSNYNREFGYHVYAYRIAYREDVDDAVRHLRAAFRDLQDDAEIQPDLLEEISIPGITALAENAVEIRVMIKTLPGAQWRVGRAYNRLVKMHFDAAGIEIPTAQRTLSFGRDKDGWSSPARIRLVDTSRTPLHADVATPRTLDTSGREADLMGPGDGDT